MHKPQTMMLLGLVALSFYMVGAQEAGNTPCTGGPDELIAYFRLSDYARGEIRAHRAWGTDARPDRVTWYTPGFPVLKRNSTGQVIYETTISEVKLKLLMLYNRMKEALIVEAGRGYRSQNPTMDDFKLMPMSKLMCTVHLSMGDDFGSVKQFTSQPFSLDFDMPEGSSGRAEFLRRINERGSDKLSYSCSVRSTLNNGKVVCDTFEITTIPQDMD